MFSQGRLDNKPLQQTIARFAGSAAERQPVLLTWRKWVLGGGVVKFFNVSTGKAENCCC